MSKWGDPDFGEAAGTSDDTYKRKSEKKTDYATKDRSDKAYEEESERKAPGRAERAKAAQKKSDDGYAPGVKDYLAKRASERAAARRKRLSKARDVAKTSTGTSASKLGELREQAAGKRISMDDSKADTSAFASKSPKVRQAHGPTVDRASGSPTKRRGGLRRVASAIGRGFRKAGREVAKVTGSKKSDKQSA